MSRIGKKISEVRMAKGMTQKQLGKAIGVTEKFIIEAESGKKVVSDDLIKKISKALGQDIDTLMLDGITQAEDNHTTEKVIKEAPKVVKQEVQKVWDDAFSSVLKTVPVYEYDLNTVIETRQLPVISNKVEGLSKDKVLYLRIVDNDMIAFRMLKGDTAFGYTTNELENNAICLVEYNGKRAVRQIKKLDKDKVLVISSSKGSLNTETLPVKGIKVLARLLKVEANL
ncbi:MAG: helix-turn-helix domain-containing protein [Clostridia bacterium]|nr:helix-turn-helix domain-containing protein [Clostridia bacterium]